MVWPNQENGRHIQKVLTCEGLAVWREMTIQMLFHLGASDVECSW